MIAGCIQSLVTVRNKFNTFRFFQTNNRKYLQYSKHQKKKFLSSLLQCVAADVGLEANLYANCLFLSLPFDIDEP